MEPKKIIQPHILAVDDEPSILAFYKSALSESYKLTCVSNAAEALQLLEQKPFDLIISDISIPGMDGIQFITEVRKKNKLIPVVLATGHPTLETAIKAVEFGALRYLTKPLDMRLLLEAIDHGVRIYRMSGIRDEIEKVISKQTTSENLSEEQGKQFDNAVDSLWMAFQPIISWSGQCLAGYEALVRNDESSLAYPPALFTAAERFGRTQELSRKIRAKAAGVIAALPDTSSLFVNLCPKDLDDPELYAASAPLSRMAPRVVLELSEQMDMKTADKVRAHMADLRKMGYRIAMDDLGAGHNGLAAFAKIEPDIVKIDIQLIRGAEKERTKLRLISSLIEICKDLNISCIAEGVETPENFAALLRTGCDLYQGYLFGKPDRALRPFIRPLEENGTPFL